MDSVLENVLKGKAEMLQLGTFQGLYLFTDKLLHRERDGHVVLEIKEVPWHLGFDFAGHESDKGTHLCIYPTLPLNESS